MILIYNDHLLISHKRTTGMTQFSDKVGYNYRIG